MVFLGYGMLPSTSRSLFADPEVNAVVCSSICTHCVFCTSTHFFPVFDSGKTDD